MGLGKMFGRDSKASTEHPTSAVERVASGECSHLALTPRWDNLEDMGKEDRATAYVCDACHVSLSPADAERARSASAQHMREVA